MVSHSTVDVLIVGAGPAGLSAALRLSGQGLSIMLVDSRKVIGSPIRCGEVTQTWIFKLLDQEPRPGWVRLELEAKGPLVVLDRARFELELSLIASAAGVTVMSSTTLVAIGPFDGQRRPATLEHGNERTLVNARCIIAADGVSSLTARKAGLNTRLPLSAIGSGVAYQMTQLSLAHPRRMTMEPLLPPWPAYPYYFWTIPNGPAQANVGLYVPGREGSRAQALLDSIIASQPHLARGRKDAIVVGMIPEARPLEVPFADGLLVCGGAARFLDPNTGGGISSAILSGRVAAEVVLEAFALGAATADALRPYRRRLEPTVYRTLKTRWRFHDSTVDFARRGLPWKEARDAK
ncbi:MAG: NAD(P)/FAD-dependent oxidoreductase [Myxococcota bacterium]|nr:NAD(P)/FAD-dependent oxidoreductase [Myxococcota bacterium]